MSTYTVNPVTGTVNANFAALEKKARRMDEASLRWSIADATQAAVNAEELGSPKAGYYRDEVHVYAAELKRRQERQVARYSEIMDAVS